MTLEKRRDGAIGREGGTQRGFGRSRTWYTGIGHNQETQRVGIKAWPLVGTLGYETPHAECGFFDIRGYRPRSFTE